MTTTESLPQILLLTYSGWRQQFCNGLRMVMDGIKDVTKIPLMPVDTLGEFYQRVEVIVEAMPRDSLTLTDFTGGTTSNMAARLNADYPVTVVSGFNASSLLEAPDECEHGQLAICVANLVEAGCSSCLDIVTHVRQLQQSQ